MTPNKKKKKKNLQFPCLHCLSRGILTIIPYSSIPRHCENCGWYNAFLGDITDLEREPATFLNFNYRTHEISQYSFPQVSKESIKILPPKSRQAWEEYFEMEGIMANEVYQLLTIVKGDVNEITDATLKILKQKRKEKYNLSLNSRKLINYYGSLDVGRLNKRIKLLKAKIELALYLK